ncbi:MAG: grasp-with-spasm system ATP-grasp peptide maturase [Saprospiraceae bacterium]|nr:grasp-with-spasm system ATP-grasp peptide maturase [Saprospiraceae bacterium]
MKYENITIIWNRRWYDDGKFLEQNSNLVKKLSHNAIAGLTSNISEERKVISNYYFNFFKNCKWTTYPTAMNGNKIIQLIEAENCNIIIPNYVITLKKSDLINFSNNYRKIITKPLSHIPALRDEKETTLFYTKILKLTEIKILANTFFPSLFQEYIEKEFEVRSFYFYGKIFSMAIFSQNQKETLYDFRSSPKKLNRRVPYKLPLDLEKKLRILMKKLELNEGSIDLIKSKKGDFVFLEVNPVGQFGMVSYPCNYNLELLIAKHLINENKKSTKKSR